MKHSIKKQLTFIYVGLIAFTMLACIVVNLFFLERFYIANKTQTLENIYQQLCVFMEEETIYDEDTETALQIIVEKSNISFMIQNEELEILAATTSDMEWLQFQLNSYQFNKNGNMITQLASAEDYEIWRAKDVRTGMEYIEMWGYLSTGESFIIRTPMESIEESVGLSSKFYLYVGVILGAISIFIIRYLAKRITDPVLALAKLSTKMANLDFEAKYTSGGNNEIGILGASFNAMSYKLEQAISDLKKANNELQQDLENKEKLEEMRTEFLSNVSHELKTPIALIQGYSEGLKEGISTDIESKNFYCEVIMDEAEKMNQLVKSLLELNQLEFGNGDLVMDRFDIVEMIKGILQSLEILIQQKECRVLLNLEDKVYVWGDQFKIEHVIRNYLTNALNHVNDENVIQIKIKQSDKVKISVFNTGEAIPEKDVDRIWEKFYKVDKARTREYGGNGIGLSVVKAIMESLHQEYGVKNYDNGVEFWFELDRK